ncbi:hypothetical protein [Antrihabitans sp. YC2-6]|uniref:hypothetical protein n=1 Tax=Antrihabitans sp. YC2-6 TaxID=2799498 RepID=UPI0018F30C2D|nr:hypothetical protein [Antrihabitans sp. YC2-6]MBJ8348273.1 hypothetical protein [Antrihabitans sp. YC2-6]
MVNLLGKHVVYPFVAPGAHPDDPQRPEKYQEFIVDVDPATGAEIRSSCERESDTFLTPVFFNSDVLTKYRDNPERYKVQRLDVTCHGLWMIDIDINDEGLVQVWLGDIVNLPEIEREHWLNYNVAPRGGVTITRALRDLAGEWVADERPDPAALRNARSDLNATFRTRYGVDLYRDLSAADARDFECLALCSNSTDRQRDYGIIILAKGLVEAIDVKVLRRLAGLDENAPSLNALQKLIETLGGNANVILGPLRLLQGLRSTGAAHVKGNNFESTLAKAGLLPLPPDKQFEQIVERATFALQSLTQLFNGETVECEGAAG